MALDFVVNSVACMLSLLLAVGGIWVTIYPPDKKYKSCWIIGMLIFCIFSIAIIVFQQFSASKASKKAQDYNDELKGSLHRYELIFQQVAADQESTGKHIATVADVLAKPVPFSQDMRPAIERMSNRQLRGKIEEFANQVNEWNTRKMQLEKNMMLSFVDELRKAPPTDEAKRGEVMNSNLQAQSHFDANYKMEFNRDFAAYAAMYKNELVRRLGPQSVQDDTNAQLSRAAFGGWLTTMSVPAMVLDLRQFALKLQ